MARRRIRKIFARELDDLSDLAEEVLEEAKTLDELAELEVLGTEITRWATEERAEAAGENAEFEDLDPEEAQCH